MLALLIITFNVSVFAKDTIDVTHITDITGTTDTIDISKTDIEYTEREQQLQNTIYRFHNIAINGEIAKTQRETYIFHNIEIKKKLIEVRNEKILKNAKKETWKIEIPKINLIANIEEGTNEEVLNKHIGHFEDTKFLKGNIGLAAHNRGYPVNYFKDIDKLNINDYIIYKINNVQRKYKVSKIKIIDDTDWSYLENTDADTITLITCVKNKPSLRLCVQGIIESEERINEKKNYSNRIISNDIAKYSINRYK